jgi:hypothetical protein
MEDNPFDIQDYIVSEHERGAPLPEFDERILHDSSTLHVGHIEAVLDQRSGIRLPSCSIKKSIRQKQDQAGLACY